MVKYMYLVIIFLVCRVENLPSIPNGEFVRKTKDVFELKCTGDYRLMKGPSYVFCQADGTWTSTTATCEGKIFHII